MKNQEPKVTLLTWTKDPLETVYSVWQASKTEDRLMSTKEVHDAVSRAEITSLFRAVIAQRIPIGEHVDFVFMLENVSVSWREQAVRHRIGTLPSPERVGADIVMGELPDLASSSWWSQSMRIQDMSGFAQRGQFRLPKTIQEHGDPEARKIFCEGMVEAEQRYKKLVGMGIPMEDARELIPLGTHHRISWKLNIGSMQHIVGKRGCWILQLGIWGPVIEGMVKELCEKVDPIFSELVTPPCLNGDDFKGCIYMEECRRRHTGDDKLPPCPLHFNYHKDALELGAGDYKMPMGDEMRERAEHYRKFWNRDPYTGVRL